MKKLLLSIFIIFALFNISGCGKEEEEKKEPTTLTEYLTSLNKDVTQYEFKCTPLENNSVIYFDYSYNQSKMFLSDGNVYDVVTNGKSFSNGEQCKQAEGFPSVKKVVTLQYEKYIITQDDDVCKYSSNYSTGEDTIECGLKKSKVGGTVRNVKLATSQDIVKVFGTDYRSSYEKNSYVYYYTFYHLNTDNKVYETVMLENGKVVSSNVLLETPNYGKISYIDATFDKSTKSLAIKKIVSDTGLYELQTVETEECTQYVDVECETLFVKNELLDKYWSSLKYVSGDLIFTNDGHLYTSYVINSKY